MDRNLCGARFNLRFLFSPPLRVYHVQTLSFATSCFWYFGTSFDVVAERTNFAADVSDRVPPDFSRMAESRWAASFPRDRCTITNRVSRSEFRSTEPSIHTYESISFIDKWWLNGSIKTRRRGRHFRDEFGVETTGIAVLYHTGHKKTFIVRHWTHYVTRTRDPSRRDSRTMAR